MRPTKICPACGELKKMTAHHIFPRRHFGRGPRNNFIFLLCWECHSELEILIPFELMPRRFYPFILNFFLQEKARGRTAWVTFLCCGWCGHHRHKPQSTLPPSCSRGRYGVDTLPEFRGTQSHRLYECETSSVSIRRETMTYEQIAVCGMLGLAFLAICWLCRSTSRWGGGYVGSRMLPRVHRWDHHRQEGTSMRWLIGFAVGFSTALVGLILLDDKHVWFWEEVIPSKKWR